MRVIPSATLAAVVLLVLSAGPVAAQDQVRFPHPTHERLAPTCSGCHELTADGVSFPNPAVCQGCHNEQIAPNVAWDGPPRKTNTVVFNHQDVLTKKSERLGMDFSCANCHTPVGGDRMDVVRVASIEACMACHGAATHAVDAPCATCHATLAEASHLAAEDIAAIPAPPTHDVEWALAHGASAAEDAATCSFCHARETCSNCHVNALDVGAIQALPNDERVARLEAGRTPTYPIPPSHVGQGWTTSHGRAAENAASCSACHAQSSCRSCHVDPVPKPVQALPPGRADAEQVTQIERGQGVQLARRAPSSHGPRFAQAHNADAAAATGTCQTCHTAETCTSCHTGSMALSKPGERVARYHSANYLQQHSAAGFSREVECASCHNPEAFCRSCHAELGQGTTGRIETGFHSEKSTFVFGHGQAARQGLETCASCHAQRDCLQCHSALGARRVNPHGPGFEPERLRRKNPALCLFCHGPSILDP